MSMESLALGTQLHQAGRYTEAIPLLQEAVQAAPTDPAALTLLGSSFCAVRDFAQGIPLLARAISLDSTFPQALCVLGGALIHTGQMAQAGQFLERSLAIAPGFSKAGWNLAQVLLWRQEWQRGFELYEYGRTTTNGRPNYFIHRPWDGSEIRGKTLLLWAEQGFGDVLQFLRFAPYAKEISGANITLLVQPALVDLVSTAFPWASVLASNPTQTVIQTWDYQAPLLSLPYIMGVGPDHPEIRADWASGVVNWTPDERRWGLCWTSSAGFAANEHRTIPADDVKVLAGVKDWLKVGGPEDEALPFDMQVMPQRSFYESAKVVAELGGIVSSCTAAVHLAGALGIRAKAVISKIGDWRWGQNELGFRNPWYPSVEVYRPSLETGFAPIMAQVAEDLR